MSACHDVGEVVCGTKYCACRPIALPVPATTASPEVKHFLVWLGTNGFDNYWQAYDRQVRDKYRRSMGASLDHMNEIARVMEDPWFGTTQQ